MIQKRFISYSLIIHLLAMSLLFIAPVAKEQKGKPFFARLVTAEDIGLESGDATHKSPKVIVPPAPPKAASLPRSSKKPSVPSAKSSASKSPQSAKSQEAPAVTTAPSGSMSQGSEDLKTSQSGIPPGTGGSFPLKRETIDSVVPKAKVFSPGQSTREAAIEIAKKTKSKDKKSGITFDAKEFMLKDDKKETKKKETVAEHQLSARDIIKIIAERDANFRVDEQELELAGYMARIKEMILNEWHYPPEAVIRMISGDLYMNFTIKKNGVLGRVELVRTSGYRSLDEAVMKAIKDAAPYWPLPGLWKRDELTVKGHFIYIIYEEREKRTR